jgi:hypothetical protein
MGGLNITLCKKNMLLGQQGFVLGQTPFLALQSACHWVSIPPLAHIVLAIRFMSSTGDQLVQLH